MKWTQFKELILNKYFSFVKRDKKKAKFMRLVQGHMTLVEYERKFDKLARYASHLVNIKVCKARHFEKRPEICNTNVVLRLPTYTNVLQRVQLITKDSTLEVPKAVGQSSFVQKKP